jgi:hypothetical protein
MYDFADDNTATNMFDVEFCSIDDVVNSVVVYKGMEERQTSNGSRQLVAVTMPDGTESAFLTSSKKIIEQVGSMQGRFPFRAVMKCVAYGGAFIGFRLFPPSAEVTDDDRRLFQQYKKTKFKR